MASVPVLSAPARRLEDKVALITGGASGIGECVATHFTRHGAKVMIADIQDELGQSLCKTLGPTATYVHCNVTKEDDVRNAVDSTVAKYGKLDIMFNNAGIVGSPTSTSILDMTQSEFDKVVKVNLTGPFLGVKHAARVMIPAKQGSIISTASLSSVTGGLTDHAYTSSKHGVVGLTRNAAVELGKHGIRVNCVSPHVVSTPMARGFFGLDEESIKQTYSNLKGEFWKAQNIADALLFLASDDSKFISGHNLMVDGGFTIMNAGICIYEEK